MIPFTPHIKKQFVYTRMSRKSELCLVLGLSAEDEAGEPRDEVTRCRLPVRVIQRQRHGQTGHPGHLQAQGPHAQRHPGVHLGQHQQSPRSDQVLLKW